MYALAAGTAGVGALALAQPSEAEVVYTKVNHTIGRNSHYAIDLNHDGITDFTIHDSWDEERFYNGSPGYFHGNLQVFPAPGAKVATSWAPDYAAALWAGRKIDGALQKTGKPALIAGSGGFFGSGAYTWGRFARVKDKYLGFEFVRNGEIHYGWARLSVADGFYSLPATLSGFAYETAPNKPIRAGQTEEDAADETTSNAFRAAAMRREVGSLGALALGASGILDRRRRESGAELS